MIRAVEDDNTGRPSWRLPAEIFAAVIELEELSHVVGATPPGPEGPCGLPCRSDDQSGLAHVQAVVNAGGARDRLAQLILDQLGPGRAEHTRLNLR